MYPIRALARTLAWCVARISGFNFTFPGLYTPCTLPKAAAMLKLGVTDDSVSCTAQICSLQANKTARNGTGGVKPRTLSLTHDGKSLDRPRSHPSLDSQQVVERFVVKLVERGGVRLNDPYTCSGCV